ncbi:leucine-rich repeat extensin-like protein 3 [Pyrus ussuriensis x Pyrus communis]|uniref:Leucine-rich repeat extensin-like protein 3 n=1 Tax=Pyrus ussuriensis x Pyrus communis TaxID=2448454 RepID=A0A5N5GNX8_9ROSA|nr:leucine-rich repeat extensin-like protein 3 [Pyrus ussuriensis x Pyrus communis]
MGTGNLGFGKDMGREGFQTTEYRGRWKTRRVRGQPRQGEDIENFKDMSTQNYTPMMKKIGSKNMNKIYNVYTHDLLFLSLLKVAALIRRSPCIQRPYVEEADPKVVVAVCGGLSKAVEEDQVAEGLVGNTVGVEYQVGGGGLVVEVEVEDGIPDGEVEVEERIPEAAVEVVDLVDAHGGEEEGEVAGDDHVALAVEEALVEVESEVPVVEQELLVVVEEQKDQEAVVLVVADLVVEEQKDQEAVVVLVDDGEAFLQALCGEELIVG